MITSDKVADILYAATLDKKVTREDFEFAFPKVAKNPTRFHDNIMREVRRLSNEGLLSRKNRGVYSITAQGRKALNKFDSR
jgi:predicted transcriptional regulator